MKTTSTTFQLSRENGDLKSSAATMTAGATAAATTATDVRKMDEFDIKILQQKRHEAEVKRLADAVVYLVLMFFFDSSRKCCSRLIS